MWKGWKAFWCQHRSTETLMWFSGDVVYCASSCLNCGAAVSPRMTDDELQRKALDVMKSKRSCDAIAAEAQKLGWE